MNGKRLLRFQVLLTFFCTALVIGGVIACYLAGLLARADNFLYDLNVVWRGPVATSDRVVLVLMDEESAVRLKRHRGQWSRKKLAIALDNLCAAGAEVVGLDMVMSAPDLEPDADVMLAASIANCNNVVLARVSSAEGVREIVPHAPFQEAMIGDGFIDVPLDEDGVLRKIRFLNAKPMADGSLQLLPSFALELARVFLNLDFSFDFSAGDHFLMGAPTENQLRLPYPELLINFYGDFNSFKVISFADAVNNTLKPEDVRGRMVLVGSTLSSQKDFFTTPYSRFRREAAGLSAKFATVEEGVMGSDEPGVACHAHAVETILNKAFIKPVNGSPIIWFTLLTGLVGLLFYIPRIGLLIELAILFLSLAAIVFVSHLLFSRSLLRVDSASFLAVFLIQFVTGVALQRSFGKKKNAMITSLFGKYVSSGVVNELIKGDISSSLEGHRENLTMLFSDLRNFTTLSERLGAKDTGLLLNVYFDTMIPIVFAHQGTLDKLMGDAVMAFYGAPLPVPDHPAQAAATALEMIEKLDRLVEKTDLPGIEGLAIGIGLNTGEVTVGNLGSNVFMDYTIIGDAVNLASRLEGLNKVYGTSILVTEFTARELDDRFVVRDLDIVKVKGKEKSVTIFELCGWRDRLSQERLAELAVFAEGVSAYRSQQWDAAEERFREVLKMNPGDGPARLYLSRTSAMRDNPPPPDWNGVTAFDHK
ncbi:MAG: adenylate/guanylate cyclase domain-containing protein [Proteobacteria bacterium]|nr:adenylate/guanylate cyclase domain-containing protein [Pseudomonadota bacterium]MBU1737456.1 adenylate/guanylate cyclase domain-containing protein [Pseudomonadota bacterium]